MNEILYFYDGSFEGFLCCIFESYAKHEIPIAVNGDGDYALSVFPCRTIETDFRHAQRVYRKVAAMSPCAADFLRRGFLTCLPDRELLLYRMVVRLLRDGPSFFNNLTDEMLCPLRKAVRQLDGEAHLLRGFVRFSELSGVLGAEIQPKNRVLPHLRADYCARYSNEKFFIYDRTHHEALFYADGRAVIAPLGSFRMAPPDSEEAGYRLLWKRFYDTISIRERYNPKCRMTQMPKRYWSTMTEFQDAGAFTAESSPGASPAPFSPGGRPAPGIPSGSEPSAPASGP